ncbi:hypothetical protein INR49_006887, partial [Caranx melampygus]
MRSLALSLLVFTLVALTQSLSLPGPLDEKVAEVEASRPGPLDEKVAEVEACEYHYILYRCLLVNCSLRLSDELIRLWWSKVTGQR